MHETVVNDEISKMNFSQVAALQQKRTLAFVNHFVITTVQFLNNFMQKCEHKLMNFENKLEKVEASMVLLEARLSSIPEINATQSETKAPEAITASTTIPEEKDNTDSSVNPTITKDEGGTTEVTESPRDVGVPPEYERFIKMVQVGVPVQAVKLKAGVEGLDTDLLEKILSK